VIIMPMNRPDITQEEIFKYIETHAMISHDPYYANDMLKTVMVELVKSGHADFLLLRDDNVNRWWRGIVGAAREAIETAHSRVYMYKVKLAAWERLTPQERRALGIRKPTKPRGMPED